MAEQRFTCHCGKGWTGMQMEHCMVCHETFNNTRAGDKHRTVEYTYAIIERGGVRQSVRQDQGVDIDRSGKVLSENNEKRRCSTPAEMLARGMSQEKNGSWNNGGNWSPDIYKEKA